jgi:site-specific recombinase XerD
MWFKKKRVLLSDVFTQFQMLYLPTVYQSAATRRGYTRDVGKWLESMSITYVDELDFNELIGYFSQGERQYLRPKTKRRRIAAFTAFLVYLEDTLHLLPKGSSRMLIWPERDKEEVLALSRDEYERLLSEASLSVRDSAIIQLLLQTGIWLHELTALTLSDVDVPDIVNNTYEHGLLRVKRRENNREVVEEIVVNSVASRALKMYLSIREDTDDPHVFLTRYNKPITDRSVQKLVKKYAVAAGIPWAHVDTLRVTHIFHHLDKGTEKKIIQANTGQKDPATLNRYVDAVKEAQIRAMQENAL